MKLATSPWQVAFRLVRSLGVSEEPVRAGRGAVIWRTSKVALVAPGTTKAVLPDAGASLRIFTLPPTGGWMTYFNVLADVAAAAGGVSSTLRDRRVALSALCMALRVAGAPQPPRAYSVGANKLTVAWPKQKVALILDGEDPVPFERGGWHVERLVGTSWAGLLRRIDNAVLALITRGSAGDATNPSSHEQIMMDALLRAGLPAPRRDVRIVDPSSGRLISQPDFAWPEVRLILDVDGIYWHLTDYVDTVLESGNGKRMLKGETRSRFVKDARKRRQSVALGWTVTTCADTEIDDGKADEIASDVASCFAALQASHGCERCGG